MFYQANHSLSCQHKGLLSHIKCLCADLIEPLLPSAKRNRHTGALSCLLSFVCKIFFSNGILNCPHFQLMLLCSPSEMLGKPDSASHLCCDSLESRSSGGNFHKASRAWHWTCSSSLHDGPGKAISQANPHSGGG